MQHLSNEYPVWSQRSYCITEQVTVASVYSEVSDLTKEFEGFMHDLILFIQEKYNQSMDKKDDFEMGTNFAYYDCLSLIESQLNAFGYELTTIRKITPNLGNSI